MIGVSSVLIVPERCSASYLSPCLQFLQKAYQIAAVYDCRSNVPHVPPDPL